jgi:hypothetical protein
MLSTRYRLRPDHPMGAIPLDLRDWPIMRSTPRSNAITVSGVTTVPPNGEQHEPWEYPGYAEPTSTPPSSIYPTSPYPTHYVQPVMPAVHFIHPVTSGFATASLVFSLIGLFTACCTFGVFSAAAVVCGHFGLHDTRAGAKGGRGQAVAGLILGYLVVAPAVALSIAFVAGS